MSEQEKPPSMNDILTALSVFQRSQPQQEQNGIAKHLNTIIVAAVIGIGGWMMTGMNSLQNTVSIVATNVAAIQKTINDMQGSQTAVTARQADMQAVQARQDARLSQVEQSQQRMGERIRIVEGQKPLSPNLQ